MGCGLWAVECGAGLTLKRCNQFGALREEGGRGHYRGKSGRALKDAQAYRVTFYRESKHRIWRGRRAARSSTSQGSAEPLCARIKGANREVSEGKADLWPRSVSFLREPSRSGKRAGFHQIGAFLRDTQGFGWLNASSREGFASSNSRPPSPWTSVFQISSIFLMERDLENLRLVDQNFLERELFTLLLRTLAVGRRQQSKSIGAALDME